MKNKLILFAILLVAAGCSPKNTPEGNTIDLTGNTWRIWLDNHAEYWNDIPVLPPVDINNVETKAPTIGWDSLFSGIGKTTTLPATVEEHFWGDNGSSFGLSGDYAGVSWFTTTFNAPANWEGKRLVLHFESVRLRAEVFVNEQLVGYDLINGTPFDVDITSAVKYGAENKLAVRLTDPDGNFLWIDFINYNWNNYKIPPSHAFMGITGNVVLEATDQSYIDDVFVKNTPNLSKVDIDITLKNINKATNGNIELQVTPWKSSEVVYQGTYPVENLKFSKLISVPMHIDNAKSWAPDSPNLYVLNVNWKDNNGAEHNVQKRFGFRWFESKTVDGDRMFFLNGKRIVLRSSISWGFWPVNGIYPTPELARKQIQTAKDLGLNMLNFHRGIGQTIILDLADEMGLLYYAEPGGYKTGKFGEFTQDWNREKMIRMIKRDRSHPSLIIYNMINEANQDPLPHEYEDIKIFHEVDPSRVITFTSTNLFRRGSYKGINPKGVEAGIKLHMLPYDTTRYLKGWWDQHFPDGPGVYLSQFYNGPKPHQIHKGSDNLEETVMWGEDGAIGSPHRLQLIKNELDNTGKLGWDGDSYLAQYEAYNNFLDNKGFRKAFATVDDLCLALGNNAIYYQSRIIENIRVNNTVDCYVVNGWEGEKVENHSGVVDIYRNPKGDASIMNYYNQPLYIAVKARELVFETGGSTLADFFIINEKDINGECILKINVQDSSGEIFNREKTVTVSGGHNYGELLVEAVNIQPKTNGYCHINAELYKGGELIAKGTEKIYTATADTTMDFGKIAIVDSTGKLQNVLNKIGVRNIETTNQYSDKADILFVHQASGPYSRGNMHVRHAMLEWVKRGHTVIAIKEADKFAEWLLAKEIADYRGMRIVQKNWYGGNYLVKEHPFFDGLPVNTAFNWEYQSLADYKKERYGLRIENGETVVAVTADHKPEMYASVVIIPVGKGQVILSTLDLEQAILQDNPASVVAKRILLNYLKYAKENKTFN